MMKPKPFVVLNHLTVPIAIAASLSLRLCPRGIARRIDNRAFGSLESTRSAGGAARQAKMRLRRSVGTETAKPVNYGKKTSGLAQASILLAAGRKRGRTDGPPLPRSAPAGDSEIHIAHAAHAAARWAAHGRAL